MDLQSIFSTVCNMTITASVVIGCVLLARMLLKKAPKGFCCALWAVVLFRLLCPVSVSAPVSVLTVVDAPKTETAVSVVEYVPLPEPTTDAVVMRPGQNGAPGQIVTEPVPETPEWRMYASGIWLVVASGLAGYGILSYVNLKKKMRASIALESGVRESDRIDTPFVLGFFRPVIYLPEGMAEREHILLHERCHVRWGDPLVKGLFYLACCLHWFNPLAWLAFVLCGRDMEMRCDEAVLRSLGPQVRSDYAQALLNFATGRRMAPAPLAFGEGDTGKRVKHVLTWKQKAAWALTPAAILCAVVLLITAVNPGGSLFGESPFGHSYKATTVVPTRYDEPVEQEQLYTLTSDMALFIRSGQNTYMEGSFKKLNSLPATCAAFESAAEWALWKTEIDNAWEAVQSDGDNYLLLQTEDGVLYLIHGETLYHLDRTDLLGVTIKQPGMDAYVEPVWYQPDSPDWYSGNLSATLVDGDAQIVLLPEKDVASIMVSEEYYMRSWDDSHSIINADYVLEPNADGEFVLEVSRRGDAGDDHAYYHVQVGEDSYMFLLSFPAVPGVTSYEAFIEEETREVRFDQGGAYIILQLPESWEYSITSLENDAYSAGITFWPQGRSEGKLRFDYYPDLFAVCGTGLKSGTMTVAGQNVSVGTYDDDSLWTFLSFGDHFAVWGENHEAWWAEYGEQAMEILNSAQFGEYVDMDAVRNYFRDYRLNDLGVGAVLRGEKDYQAVYYHQLGGELRLYEYAAAGTQVSVQNEWAGRSYKDICISINLLEREGEYVYFGYLRDTQDGVKLQNGSFHFLLEDGWIIDVILDEFKGFCFVCDSPMADFQICTESGDVVMDLDRYLEAGCEITEAEGKIVLDDLEGEIVCTLPVSPTEP